MNYCSQTLNRSKNPHLRTSVEIRMAAYDTGKNVKARPENTMDTRAPIQELVANTKKLHRGVLNKGTRQEVPVSRYFYSFKL